MVNSVDAGTTNVSQPLKESSSTQTKDQVSTTSSDTAAPTATLAEDSVTLSDEARAALMGDPDWPEPPKQQ